MNLLRNIGFNGMVDYVRDCLLWSLNSGIESGFFVNSGSLYPFLALSFLNLSTVLLMDSITRGFLGLKPCALQSSFNFSLDK